MWLAKSLGRQRPSPGRKVVPAAGSAPSPLPLRLVPCCKICRLRDAARSHLLARARRKVLVRAPGPWVRCWENASRLSWAVPCAAAAAVSWRLTEPSRLRALLRVAAVFSEVELQPSLVFLRPSHALFLASPLSSLFVGSQPWGSLRGRACSTCSWGSEHSAPRRSPFTFPCSGLRPAVCFPSQPLFPSHGPSHPVPTQLGSPRKIYQVSPQGRPNLPSRTGPFSFKPKYLFSCKTLFSS